MAQPRLVLVDDTNPSIQYSGPWFEAQNTQATTGDFGPPFDNTLHGVNVNASFSYAFSGSSVSVLGTSITSNVSGTQDPSWECFVDNTSIASKSVLSGYAENNWVFCQGTQLNDGPHVLSVNATVSNQETFWFDQIQYLPSASVSLSDVTLRIDPTDPAIQYSSGWSELNGISEMTQTTGSTITLAFSGVSLSFVGYLPPNFPLIASSATYSIDGQTPTNFFVPTGAAELYNQVFFQTGQLSAGQHNLVVTHQGNSSTSPLALNYFVVQGSANSTSTTATSTISGSASLNTSIATSVSSITSSSGVASSSSSGSSGLSRSRGAIIGSVLGAFVLLSLLLILIFCYRRRKNRGAWRSSEKPLPPDVVNPFNSPPTESSRHTSKAQQPLSPQSTYNNFVQGRSTIGMNFSGSTASTSSPMTGLTDSQFSGISPPVVGQTSQTSPMTSSVTKGGHRIVEPMQQPVSRQDDDNSGYVRAQDSGVRIELPPLYTPG